MYCSMQGCGLTRQSCRNLHINMFLFPTIPKQRRAWMASCKVQSEPQQDAFVCALHFDVNDVMRLENSKLKCIPAQRETWLEKIQMQAKRSKKGSVCAVTFGEKDIEPECDGTSLNRNVSTVRGPKPLVKQCRSCLGTDSNAFVDMLTVTTDGLNLYDYFNECTHLGATVDDELPQMLCLTCSFDLNTAYNFLQEARRSDASLRLIVPTTPEKDYDDTINQDIFEDPLGDIEAAEAKPYTEEILPEIDEDVEERLNEEQLVAIEFERNRIVEIEIERKCNDEMDAVEDRSSCIGYSPELKYAESQTENETEDEHIDESMNKSINNKNTRTNRRKCETKCWTCHICQTIIPTLDELRQHLNEDHKSNVTCEKCSKSYNFPQELEEHNDLIHGKNSTVQCRHCPERPAIPRSELANHFRLKHCHRYHKYFPHSEKNQKKSEFQCSVCLRYFMSVALLTVHMQLHVDNKPYKCRFCPKDFNMKQTFQAHLKRAHDGTGCIEAFQRKTARKAIANNAPIKYDPRSRLDIEEVDIEEEYEDSNELIQCTECNKRLPPLQFKNHKAWHDQKRKRSVYLCSFCPRFYNNEMALQEHENEDHLNERPRKGECPICQRKVKPNYLRTHIKEVHVAGRNCICNICGNAFKTQSHLNSHSKLHQKRDYECDVCCKKYIRSYDLKVHMRSHTGEQPYECNICDKRFSMKMRLTYHMQEKHSGVKHRCNECGKEFNNKGELWVHLYKHTGMPYRCPTCGYGCVKREAFKRHLKGKHAIVMTEPELRAIFKKNTGRMPRIPTIEELKSSAPESGSNFEYDK